MSGVRSTLFRERGVAAAMFRERALLHFTTLFRGQRRVAAASFRENALLHYQACYAANRDVILSRRACGTSKNLLRFPQSSFNAIMSALLYPTPL